MKKPYLSNGGYSDIVPQKYALMLKNEIGYPLEEVDPIEGDWWYIEDCEDTQIYYSNITWAEVFDWLTHNGIFIAFKPWFTFALRDHVCYTYQISYIDETEGRLIRAVESEEASSFNLAAIASIEEVMKSFSHRFKQTNEKLQKDINF